MTGFVVLVGTALGTVVFTIWRQPSFFSRPAVFVLHLCAATLLPLAGYLVFLRIGYTTFSWAPFSSYGLVPVGIAASASAAALVLLLYRQSLRLATKLVLFSAGGVAWFALLMVLGTYIACSAGDCL